MPHVVGPGGASVMIISEWRRGCAWRHHIRATGDILLLEGAHKFTTCPPPTPAERRRARGANGTQTQKQRTSAAMIRSSAGADSLPKAATVCSTMPNCFYRQNRLPLPLHRHSGGSHCQLWLHQLLSTRARATARRTSSPLSDTNRAMRRRPGTRRVMRRLRCDMRAARVRRRLVPNPDDTRRRDSRTASPRTGSRSRRTGSLRDTRCVRAQ